MQLEQHERCPTRRARLVGLHRWTRAGGAGNPKSETNSNKLKSRKQENEDGEISSQPAHNLKDTSTVGDGPEGLRHLRKSLKKQWKRYRKEIKRCQDEFSEKAVHRSRVTARRLLSTMELVSGFLPAQRVEKVQRALKRHLNTFDELRDTQVQ